MNLADMLGFRMPLSGEWARYRVIVFGGKSSPFIFCGTQSELREMATNLGVHADKFVYVDDWLLVTPECARTQANMDRFEEVLRECGFV